MVSELTNGTRRSSKDLSVSEDRSILDRQLRQRDGPTDCFTPVGEKKNAYLSGWNDGDAQELHEIDSSNVGLVAGRGLIALDRDGFGREPEDVSNWFDTNPTLTIESAHGNPNPVFLAPENTPKRFSEVFGSANPTIGDFDLELNTEGSMVVLPGSTYVHQGCSDGKQCSYSPGTETTYSWVDPDVPLARLTEEDIEHLIGVLREYRESPESVSRPAGAGTGERTVLPCEVDRRTPTRFEQEWIDQALGWDNELKKRHDWCLDGGHPEDHGLPHADRSNNEVGIAVKLYRRMGDFQEPDVAVCAMLDEWNPPKWSEGNSYYQNYVLATARSHTIEKGEYWTFDQESTSESERTRMLGVWANCIILSVHLDFEEGDVFTAREVKEKSRMESLSTKHIQKTILKDLCDFGYLSSRRGNGGGYKVLKSPPVSGKEHQMLKNRYKLEDHSELLKQRREAKGEHW